jgi:hypothetical protein
MTDEDDDTDDLGLSKLDSLRGFNPVEDGSRCSSTGDRSWSVDGGFGGKNLLSCCGSAFALAASLFRLVE